MPAALSIRERQQIVEMRQEGQSFTTIATQLNRDYETVRKIYHRYVQSGQIAPSYDKCRSQRVRTNEAVYQRAIQ